jgi:hypothetical protein
MSRVFPPASAARASRRFVRPCIVVCAGLLGILGFAAGCAQPGHFDRARTGPLYTPTNVYGEPSLGGLRRVVVLPVWSGEVAAAETAATLDESVVLALQQQKRFEVTPVSRDWLRRRFRVEAVASSGALPHDLLTALKREFAADGIVLVDLTAYHPYRPLGLGFRAKLAPIDGSRLIWTFDEVFLSDHAPVANAARNHFLELEGEVPVDMTHSVLQSPTRFAQFATAAMFATLPPVEPPILTAGVKR